MPEGDEMENELLLPDLDRVAGVVAALGADDDVGLLRQNVDDLALPLIAPLGADQNCIHEQKKGLAADARVGESEGTDFLRVEEIAPVE